MVTDSEHGNSQTKDVQQQTLIEQIKDFCRESHLSYDGQPPTKVSPGVWKFYATEMNHACRRQGQCREQVYHACLLGKTVQIC